MFEPRGTAPLSPDSFNPGTASINSKQRFVDTTLTAYNLLEREFANQTSAGTPARFRMGMP